MADSTELFRIITEGACEELQGLLEQDAALADSRNGTGVSALMTAAYYRKTDMVGLLRDTVSRIDVFEAAMLGEDGQLMKLLDGVDVNSLSSADGFTPLHLAAFFNRPATVKLLLERGSEVNPVAGNPSKVRPLHSAVACGSAGIVRLLLESGAEVNAVQAGGWTALQAASKHGDREIVGLLLQHGADPEQQADDGSTAISMAGDDAIRKMLTGDK